MSFVLGMDRAPLLRPVVALAGWTFVMELWMYATRLPAMTQYNVSTDPETCKDELATKVPPKVRWVADNFNHLHEQPTVFYAVAMGLAVLGDRNKYTKYGLWAYVGARVAHSVMHATVNKVMVRFQIFAASGVVLAGLTGRLAALVF